MVLSKKDFKIKERVPISKNHYRKNQNKFKKTMRSDGLQEL